jgi:hypothetical protein
MLPGLVLLCLAALPWPARAEDDKPSTPGFILRTKSVDGLMDDFKYLAELSDKQNEFQQFQDLLKGPVGNKSPFEGIDTKKPLAVYGQIGAGLADSQVVVMVPVSDEKSFLALLQRVQITAEKDKDGVYKASSDGLAAAGQMLYFRLANNYAYVTVNDVKNIAKDKLLLPAQVLPTDKQTSLSLVVRLDQIPAELKQIVLGQFELQLGNAKDKQPGETEAAHLFRTAMLDETAVQLKSVLVDGQDLSVNLDVDRKTEELTLNANLTAKSGSKLATTIADIGKAKSVASSLIGSDVALNSDAALNVLVHAMPSENFRKALEPAVDAAFKQTLEEEKDKGKRAIANKFFKLLEPSYKSGELDAGGSLRGPNANGLFVGVGAIKVKDGLALEKAVKDLVKDAPAEEKKEVDLDFDKVKGVNIHRIRPGKDYSDEARKAFGENPVYVAFREDAVFLSLGEGGLTAIKDAITAEPKAGKAMEMDLAMGRLARILGKDQEDAIAAAKKAFAKAKTGDRLSITLEGGKSLKFHGGMKAQLVTFFTLVSEAKNKGESK